MTKKVAIVTGGSSGLGFATAKKFCDSGIKTYIIGRDPLNLENARKALGENAVAVLLDLNNLEDIKKTISDIGSKEQSLDILVNNAGINMKKPLEEVNDSDFQSVLHTNLNSMFAITREVVHYMKRSKFGCVVNVSSMAAQYGIPYVVAYSASKTAVEGMTRAMAVELSEFGILVNCVAPGFIKTKMTSKALDNDATRKAKVLSRTPLGKMGEPSDIANAIFFLCSEEARYITGVTLPVDGGNSIGF